ncbi:hypothetical protein [Nocardioides nematodiphilus]|nr:hypothetical protein [Nocardioides nematodiphilus]
MKESKVSKQLTLHWVPVVDAQGRTHMEAVWTTDAVVHTAHAA